MTFPLPPQIHPTAVLSDTTELAADVRVGAFCVLEGEVSIGRGCVLEARCHFIGPLTVGQGNHFFPGCVIGGFAQHLAYKGDPMGVEVSDDNVFREKVTVHSGTAPGGTRIGTGNLFLPDSHVGHDCRVGDGCVLEDGALLGGHCVVSNGARLGKKSAVHQFCRLGRLCLLAAGSSATKDVPPFAAHEGRNVVVGLNEEGLRDVWLTEEQMAAVRRAFEVIYHGKMTLPAALAEIEREAAGSDVLRELVEFIRGPGRGVRIGCR
jgi:UDP-N-acetylglucosamine acyltransferase